MKLWRILAATATLCAAAIPCLSQTAGDAAAEEVVLPPVPVYKVSPKHPQAYYEKAIEGAAVVIVTVDRFGNAVDPEIESATNEEFGLAAMLAASEWVFEPATRNTVPIEIKVKLPFVFQIALEHKMNIEFGRPLFVELDIPITPSSELDKDPLPSFVPAFSNFYPEELRGTGQSASVNVEYVISPTGEVLNPRIISITTPGFEHAALSAVASMQYNPIVIDGKPIYVSMIRPIQMTE